MSQELITQQAQQMPFGRASQMPSTVNVGAVAIEQERAVAEAQGQLILAKRFPRDLTSAHAELMMACKSPSFASQAFYTVPNRGHGPSIRFAEEVARVYGNFQYGHRELSRSDGKSEIEVFAWDMQNNNRSIRQITVDHVQFTKSGIRKLADPTDIDNKIANVASKQIRGRILALMPKWLVADAIDECKKTLAGNNTEPLAVRVRRMTQAFTQFGVTAAHLERYLGHSLDDVLIDELVDLQGVFNSLREGGKASDYFGEPEREEASSEQAASLEQTAKAGARTRASSKAEAKQKAQQQAPEQPTEQAKAEAKPAEESKPVEPISNHAEEPAADEPAQSEAGAEPEQQTAAGTASDDIF